MKEEMDIYVEFGGRKIPYLGLSSGQQQRINIALLVAVYMWGREIGSNNFDFLLLDEVLDLSLAKKGQEDVVEFINSLLSHIRTIILISHKENISSKFDFELFVRRDSQEVSHLELN